MIDLFESVPACYLATTADGVPNVIPIGFKWVRDGKLILADIFLGKTRENLRAHSRVAVAIANGDPKRGFQFKGTATVHTSGAPWETVRELLRERGVQATPHAAVVIDVEEVYALDPGPNAGRRLL